MPGTLGITAFLSPLSNGLPGKITARPLPAETTVLDIVAAFAQISPCAVLLPEGDK
jgi:hypothetical protein